MVIGQHSRETSWKSEHERLGQVARRKKKERFCGWVANWARGIDKDHPPTALKEYCSPESPEALSPALAFVRVHYQSSMNVRTAMQPQRHAMFSSGPHLCSVDLGLLRKLISA